MNPSLNSRASVLTLIAVLHLGAGWMIASGLGASPATPAVPLPMMMVDMLPIAPPVQQEQPRQKPPEPERPKPVKPRPQPKKVVAKPEAPRTVASETALAAPETKPEPAPVVPTPAAVPAEAAPPVAAATPATAAPPAPATPPRFNAAYLNNPAPEYPRLLRRAGEEGRVVLRVLVTVEGLAGEVQVFRPSTSRLFDDAAVEAVRKWRFVPARRGDGAVAEWVQVPIDFRLN